MDHEIPPQARKRLAALRTALLLGCLCGAAAAQTPGDGLPPGVVRSGNVVTMAPIPDAEDAAAPNGGGERRAGLIHVLSAADHELYEHALDAADRGDWIAARGLADQGHDPIARQIVQWRYLLDRNSGASFTEIDAFLRNYPDWPNRDTLYARAEKAMDPNMEAHAVLAWFGDRAPVSDIGKVRLGEALIATGATTRGRELVREGWIDGSFEPDEEFQIIQRDGALLTPEVDRARLLRLISRNDLSAARRELSRVPEDAQRVGEARLALRTSPTSGQRMVADLPDALKDDPGVVLDRTRLLRQQMDVDDIPKLLVRAPTRELAAINPSHWWSELNLDAREALQASSYSTAYSIVAHTGLTAQDGTNYSEAQFMAGWIALRFLKEPQSALAHFKNLEQAVSRPISRARAHYWEGRSYEADGDLASAWREYKAASEAPETFYGQLALARLSAEPELHLKEQTIEAGALRNEYEHEALTRAVRVLADLGQENYLRDFASHDVTVYSDPRHIKLLAEDLVRMGYREVAVRVAKEASYDNVSLLSYSHPVIALPAYNGPGMAPEAALILGVIRQETEFDPDAVSGAGARGIIQVMPSSVRHIAREGGLPYRPNDLNSDPSYDLKLGMTEIAGELSDWGGSYVLAVAAYNAGPTNVRRWIAQFGDPRDARVDPVDWIEEIPFSETRNYVQRVLENMEVYRNRLAGRDQKLQILTDLYRPDAPQVKPLAYVPPAPEPSVPVPTPKPAPAGGEQASASDGEPSGVVPRPKPDR